MISRRIPTAFAAVALACGASLAGAVPAHAEAVGNGTIQLVMSHNGPIMIDDNGLIYDMHLKNNGPDTATGVVVHVSGYFCQGADWSRTSCVHLPDRDDPTKDMSFDIAIGAVPPGAEAVFPVFALLPNENSGTVRTTAEVVAEDQVDTGSVPHTCSHGWNPQPDCMSDVVTMS